jgi:hypothetical protein
MASPVFGKIRSILGGAGISMSSLFLTSCFCESTARPSDAQRRNENDYR